MADLSTSFGARPVHELQHRNDPCEPSVHFPASSFSPHLAGRQRDHEEDLQMPWRVRELHHPDLLAAAARVSGGGHLPQGEVPQGPEGGLAAGGREQRCQPGRHRRDLQLHLQEGAGPLGRLP